MDGVTSIEVYGYANTIPVTSITLDPTTASMTVGGTLTLTPTVLPDNATDKTVTWTTSDNTAVATVANGVVTAVAPGTATITATANDGSGKQGTCTVTVNAASYTITWKNDDGSTLRTDTVTAGTTPDYGTSPTKPGDAQYTYSFAGWTPTVVAASADATYTATYTTSTNGYTVTWKNDDGTVLETDTNVPYGTTPEYNGATPTKTGTAEFSYSFNGWSPEVTAVTGNATYTATYAGSTNGYTVTWVNDDGTVLETDANVPYGATPTYDGARRRTLSCPPWMLWCT